MTAALARYWAARSARERILLTIAGALSARVIFWLLAWGPVAQAIGDARVAARAASARAARVTAMAATIRQGETAARARGQAIGDVGAFVTTSASGAGLALTRNDAAGNQASDIALNGDGRAVMRWLLQVEAQGLVLRTLTIDAGTIDAGTGGSVTARAHVVRAGSATP